MKVLFEIECPSVLQGIEATSAQAGKAPWIWPLRIASLSKFPSEEVVLLPAQTLVRTKNVTRDDAYIYIRGELTATPMETLAPLLFCLL